MRLPDTAHTGWTPEPVYPRTVKIDGLYYASVWTDGKRYEEPRRVLSGPFERRSEAAAHWRAVKDRQDGQLEASRELRALRKSERS